MQLMHTGRVTQVANLPAGAEVVGPMADVCPGEMYTDSQGMQPHSAPRAMTATDIAHAVEEYAKSAQLAIEAGFDGVELHAANGYLIEQFLNANVNQRTDAYGGSIDGRNRFALEVARATVAAIAVHLAEQAGSGLRTLFVSLVRIAQRSSRGRDSSGRHVGFVADGGRNFLVLFRRRRSDGQVGRASAAASAYLGLIVSLLATGRRSRRGRPGSCGGRCLS